MTEPYKAPLMFQWTSRSLALQETCPECSSAPGEACKRDPLTIPSHQARHDMAIAHGSPVIKVQATSQKQREALEAKHNAEQEERP